MATDGLWTLDELVQRVADVLAGAAYPGAPNGRVRDVPDRRAVRWYATIGLVDRPAAVQGRTARYGTRHLLQLVALKRRQAEGHTLAEIQAELTGATDATLGRIAALPDTPPATAERPAPDRPHFWADRPMPSTPPAQARPAPMPSASTPPAAPARPKQTPASTPPAPLSPARSEPEWIPAPTLTGIPLGGGAVLLVPGRPDTGDLTAIPAAARPLLDLLAARGLLTTEPPGATDPGATDPAGTDTEARDTEARDTEARDTEDPADRSPR